MGNKIIKEFKLNSRALIVLAIFGLTFPSFILAIAEPTVVTGEATNIDFESVRLNGEVTDCRGCCQLEVWFEYGQNVSYPNRTPFQTRDNIGSFANSVSNLSSCTLYHFRAAARNNFGTGYGEDKTFSTICRAPTIDLKANNSDGPITIPYNTSATLSWTSSNATSCSAVGDWSGSKPLSGSEATPNLTSAKTYTLTCTGPGGTANDSVTVNVGSRPTLSVTLEAIPSSGTAPLNDVDLRATVSGTATGPITYKFDCTNDGSWEYVYENINDNPKTVADACDYSTGGTYNAKVYVERGTAEPVWAVATITISSRTPVVDIKANNSDGPITVSYNNSATLSWTSSNTSSCSAVGDWSGSKPLSGSEATPNLTSAKTYTLTCTGDGGSTTDSVTIYVVSLSLFVSLSTSPSSGCYPLSGVSLSVSVSGTARGDTTFLFDCNNDGTWEKIDSARYYYDSYTASNLCNYTSTGTYTARVRAERQGVSAENTAQVNVYSCYSSPVSDIKINNSDGPITIPYNTTATLSWTSSNATSCSASGGWSGSKSLSGSESTGNLTASKIYTITCSGQGGSVSDNVVVNVLASISPTLTIEKLVRNLSDGTGWLDSVSADPGEAISFLVKVTAGDSPLENVNLKSTLPEKLQYRGNLKIDGNSFDGNVTSGINIGNFSPRQTKAIIFDTDLAGSNSFTYGETQLVGSSLAYTSNTSSSDTAKVIVTKKAVAGAATEVSTGLTNNIFLDSFFLPLVITLIIIWFFKSNVIKFEEWLDSRKSEYQKYKSRKLLQLKVKKVKIQERLRKI